MFLHWGHPKYYFPVEIRPEISVDIILNIIFKGVMEPSFLDETRKCISKIMVSENESVQKNAHRAAQVHFLLPFFESRRVYSIIHHTDGLLVVLQLKSETDTMKRFPICMISDNQNVEFPVEYDVSTAFIYIENQNSFKNQCFSFSINDAPYQINYEFCVPEKKTDHVEKKTDQVENHSEITMRGSVSPVYFYSIYSMYCTTVKICYGPCSRLFDGLVVDHIAFKCNSNESPSLVFLQHVQTRECVFTNFENLDFENYEIWAYGLSTNRPDLYFEARGIKSQKSLEMDKKSLDVWLPMLQEWQDQQTKKQELEKERLSQLKSNPVEIKQLENGKSVPVFKAMSNAEMAALLENQKKEQQEKKARLEEKKKDEKRKEMEFRQTNIVEKDPNSTVFILPED